MTTTPVRFDFLCYRVGVKFDESYDIPLRIVRAGDHSDKEKTEGNPLWNAAMNTIMEHREDGPLARKNKRYSGNTRGLQLIKGVAGLS